MKKNLLLVLLSFVLIHAHAQSGNAVVFAENGEMFYLLLNGVKVNSAASANVKATSLTNEFYQARIDFEDPSLPDFSNGNFAIHPGFEVTYMIKKNKKGEYVLRWQGESQMSVLVEEASDEPSNDVRRVANADDQPTPSGNAQNSSNNSGNGNLQVGMNIGASGNGSSTATSPGTQGAGIQMGVNTGGDEGNVQFNLNIQVNDGQGAQSGQGTDDLDSDAPSNVSMNMQVDGVNMGVQMNVNDMQGTSNVQQSTTVTGSSQVQVNHQSSSNTTSNTRPQEVTYTGRCASSMDQTSFNNAKNSINSKSFEDSKLTLAKQVTKSNCMTAAQIKEVMGLFSFEETKLDFAKYAYDYCYNQGNYYEVNDGFGFESTIEELNQYLEGK